MPSPNKYYNVWHKVQQTWTRHNQDSSKPWRLSLEEAKKEFEYLTGGSMVESCWEILEMDENLNPIRGSAVKE